MTSGVGVRGYGLEFNRKSGKVTKAQLTDFNFPSFTVSKRGYTQTDDSSLTLNTQIGLSIFVDFNSKTQKCIFNNSKGE